MRGEPFAFARFGAQRKQGEQRKRGKPFVLIERHPRKKTRSKSYGPVEAVPPASISTLPDKEQAKAALLDNLGEAVLDS